MDISQYVVIGTSPFADRSVTVGPFRSLRIAGEAHEELEHLGYVAETCELLRVRDLEPLAGAAEGD